MSALKFTCPVCGQTMQCEKAYVGHQVPCPACGAELRVPVSDLAAPNALPHAELVSNASPTLAVPSKTAAASEIPQEIVVSHSAETKPAAAAAISERASEIICPVCQSHLHVPRVTPGTTTPPVAAVAQNIPAPAAASPGEVSPLEREQQIAAARAAHPVELHPPIKPRLSYILSGGAAPTETEKKAEPNPDESQTRTE